MEAVTALRFNQSSGAYTSREALCLQRFCGGVAVPIPLKVKCIVYGFPRSF